MKTTDRRRVSVPPTLSVLLDLIRVGLALMVAIGHWTQPAFQEGWPDLTKLAQAAVGGFFVLSGYTIRMIYPTPEGFDLRRYMVERISRLWSVVLPALVLTAALDWTTLTINHAYYIEHWGDHLSHPVWRILVNAFGLSQLWGSDISPLTNSPFWSIGYEWGFYVVFGLWYAKRRVWAIVALALLGPNIAVAFGFWLLGVVVYDLLAKPLSRWHVLAIGVLGVVAAQLTRVFGRVAVPRAFEMLHLSPGRTDFGLMASALASTGAFAVVFWWAQRRTLVIPQAVVARARQLGNLTFPLYLLHFPMFVLLGASGLYDRGSVLQKVGLFLVVVTVIAVITPATDRLKMALRTWLSPRRPRVVGSV